MSVITISRQFGSAGRDVAKRVSELLDYTFIDVEITRMIAKKAKVTPGWVHSIEKEAGGSFLNIITKLVSRDFLERILDDSRGYIDQDIYISVLHDVLKKFAEEDNVVILGRYGQYILKDLKDTYHFLLVAEKEDRIKFLKNVFDLSPTKAENIIKRQDKRRLNMYRKIGKEDYDKAKLYHVVFNMSKMDMDVEKAASAIVEFIRLCKKR